MLLQYLHTCILAAILVLYYSTPTSLPLFFLSTYRQETYSTLFPETRRTAPIRPGGAAVRCTPVRQVHGTRTALPSEARTHQSEVLVWSKNRPVPSVVTGVRCNTNPRNPVRPPAEAAATGRQAHPRAPSCQGPAQWGGVTQSVEVEAGCLPFRLAE